MRADGASSSKLPDWLYIYNSSMCTLCVCAVIIKMQSDFKTRKKSLQNCRINLLHQHYDPITYRWT